ncbi:MULTISPECIES: IDEAL domain-containing protein [Paenibacillus]|uniref:IDEAL domain-containing protein n=1 Tax=Paenibacillus lignilyticus TaxID=1172615 RepID=A0ABS5CF54_9BACL|nr:MULTISPECIES: IDEAL domain-containing protein [Paenibacillus]MBP3964490.1 IDEAL domain-containing protein [Paenibacillus lignilyticus]SDW30105.1 IDEAL domain-containing protein [Paenibacillus sp. CF384]SFS81059.1 IDEAL domain-containing protein [Paenibacillus sp. BC26]
MDKMKVSYEVMLGLAAEMLLDEAVLKFRRDKLYQAIDQALASGDKDKFRRLTDELKSLYA